MDINAVITAIVNNLPVAGAVAGGLIVAAVAVLRAIAAKKGAENTKADEVAAGLEKAVAYIEDLTDGHPDINLKDGK